MVAPAMKDDEFQRLFLVPKMQEGYEQLMEALRRLFGQAIDPDPDVSDLALEKIGAIIDIIED